MPIEEFHPEPPAEKPNFLALGIALVLVCGAAFGVYEVSRIAYRKSHPKHQGPKPAEPQPARPVRAPSVEEVTDERIDAAKKKGISLALDAQAATKTEKGGLRWSGSVLLRNDGAEPVQVEKPDAGNTYIQEETVEGMKVRCRQESRAMERATLAPGSSFPFEWEDSFQEGITRRFRFVHVEEGPDGKLIVASAWIEPFSGGGK